MLLLMLDSSSLSSGDVFTLLTLFLQDLENGLQANSYVEGIGRSDLFSSDDWSPLTRLSLTLRGEVIIRSFNYSPAREIEPSAKQHFILEDYLTMRMHHQENSATIDGLTMFLPKRS
ncbi:hypothetical protein ABKV19_009207 [Rosa sericea]